MRRLIEARAVEKNLIDKGHHCKRYALGETWELNYKEIREAIGETPTVKAIPIEWIKNWMAKSVNTYNREQVYELLKDWEKDNECRGTDKSN